MRLSIFLLFLFINGVAFSQETAISEAQLQKYKENQYALDKNYGGMGPMIFKPNFGKGVEITDPWFGVSMLSDVLEFQFAVGKTNLRQPIKEETILPSGDWGSDFGYMMSVGGTVPINALNFGSYKNQLRVFRGHPTVGGAMGWYNFKSTNQYNHSKTNLYFLNINPGYRVRLSVGSIEANLNMRLGFHTGGGNYQFYRASGIYPSLTFRMDAMKGLLNPSLVSVSGSLTTVDNVQTDTRYTGSRHTSGGRIDYYTTTTTADVTVTPLNVGVQDVGPYFGIGPKLSFMSPRRSDHINLGRLVGVAAEGRISAFDFGVTLEGGNIGHGSALDFKGENKPSRKLDKTDSEPIGTLNTLNMYATVGFDISPIFLMPFGIIIDKGEATSFLSSSAGFIIGGHYAFGQQYDNPIYAEQFVDDILENDPALLKNKFVDPSDVGGGFLGGYYFAVHIGAVSFKATNYRYYGAPFAGTTMYSVAWKYPLVFDR